MHEAGPVAVGRSSMVRIIPVFLFSEKEMKIWFKWDGSKFPLFSSYAEKCRRHPSEITKNTVRWWRLQFKETNCPGNRSLTFSKFMRFFFSLPQQRNDISLYLVSREFFQGILMDHNNKSLSSAVKPWTHFLRKRNCIVRCKGLLNIMRVNKSWLLLFFPSHDESTRK